MQQGDGDEIRKYSHCLTQLAGVYLRLVMDSEVEKRLQAIEERFSNEKPYG
jgi:hypothetical protein